MSKGSVAIFTLLIVSGFVVTGLGLSLLVISSLRQTQLVSDATVAYYAAESALEYDLYQIRRRDDLPATNFAGQMPLSSMVTSDYQEAQSQINFRLLANQAYGLDVYSAQPAPQFVRSVRLWADDTDAGQLIVGWAGWSPEIVYNDFYQQTIVNADQLDGYLLPLAQGANANAIFWRLRFMALDGDFNNITLKAYSDVAGQDEFAVDIPGLLSLSATGTFRRSQRTISVAMPRTAPLSEIFSYVLFSSQEINK